MPEGHTIHRLAADLNASFRGDKVVASSPQGRFSGGAKLIDGQTCEAFEAFGKHLVGHFENAQVLHVHLGLIGKFRKSKGEPRGAVRLRLTTPELDHSWDLRGPMVCTVGTPDLAIDVADSVGPDPLRTDASPEEFVARIRRRRIPVGAALLDQKIIAGIGNVYRSEFLFLAGIDPRTPAKELDDDQLELLWDMSVSYLKVGKRLNRIVTVDPAEMNRKTVRSLKAGERLYAYKRDGQPCRRCDTPIELLEVAGRKMWECPTCQPSM